MVRYGTVSLCGLKIKRAGCLLGAFGPGGESDCRAVNEIHDEGFYYLTVGGDSDGETISFKVYDSGSDRVYPVYCEDKDKEKAIFHTGDSDDGNDSNEALDLNGSYTYYRDADGDGHGNAYAVIEGCTQPVGYVIDGNDCDDSDPEVFPGNPEISDGKDNNCDGIIPVNEMNGYNFFPNGPSNQSGCFISSMGRTSHSLHSLMRSPVWKSLSRWDLMGGQLFMSGCLLPWLKGQGPLIWPEPGCRMSETAQDE